MPLPRVQVAQTAEGVEALEDGLGELGEVLEAAQLVEAAAESAAGTVGHVPVRLPDAAERLDPVDPRQADVQQDEVDVLRGEKLQVFEEKKNSLTFQKHVCYIETPILKVACQRRRTLIIHHG